jgi:hypothetical protein
MIDKAEIQDSFTRPVTLGDALEEQAGAHAQSFHDRGSKGRRFKSCRPDGQEGLRSSDAVEALFLIPSSATRWCAGRPWTPLLLVKKSMYSILSYLSVRASRRSSHIRQVVTGRASGRGSWARRLDSAQGPVSGAAPVIRARDVSRCRGGWPPLQALEEVREPMDMSGRPRASVPFRQYAQADRARYATIIGHGANARRGLPSIGPVRRQAPARHP